MRALLLVLAIALAPVAAWAQSTPNWVYGYVPPASEWNAWWAKKADFPLSTLATGGVNGTSIGSPLYNWGAGQPGNNIPSSSPFGQAQASSLYLPGGSIQVVTPRTYCCEDREVAGSFIVNPGTNTDSLSNTVNPGFTGSLLEDPTGSRVALTSERGSGAVFMRNQGMPPLNIDNGSPTFDGTHYYPSTALSSSQVAQLRKGMIIDAGPANTATMYSGMITGWATDGSSVTVAGWYQANNQATGQTPPNGLQTYIDWHRNIWDEDMVLKWDSTSLVSGAIGSELDMINDSGVDSNIGKADFVAYDAFSEGTNAIFSGLYVHGPMVSGVYIASGTFAGITYSPDTGSTAPALFSNQSAGYFIQNKVGSTNYSTISANGNAYFAGTVTSAGTAFTTMTVSGNTAGSVPAGNFSLGWNYSSGAQEGDFFNGATSPSVAFRWYAGSTLLASLGPTGALTTIGAINAPQIFATQPYYEGGVAGVTCSGAPTSSFASVGGIVTHC
jgi:hypothetical protein